VSGARAVCAVLASMASTAGMLVAFDGTAAATAVTATLFVADGATGTCTQTSPCGSIQTAVSEGEGYSGEAVTVHVGPGTYSGGITVSAGSLASLTIEGSGAGSTKVTGTSFTRDFLVSAGTVSIDDLTVTDALATTGAGVFNQGTLTLARDTFSENLALNVGGAICNTGTLVAINDYFTDDSATYGGDVYNSHTATFMATEDTFAGNFGSATFGGGIVNAGTATATDDTFIGGTASTGGGIYNVGTLTATDDTFSRNHALFQGGGIQNDQGSVTATNDTFFQNSAGTTTATVLNADGTFTATDDTFSTGSQTGILVGSIATEHGSFTATDSIFYGIRCFAVTTAVVSPAYNVVTDQCRLLGSPVSASAFDLSPNLQSTTSVPTAPATLSLGPRSAAVDEVPSSACTVTVDERGDHRPGVTGQTRCDAGAYELQGTGKAPSIVSADHATFAVGEAGTFQVLMAPGVFPTPTYSLTGAPSWLSLTAGSGTIAGTPPTGTGGTYSFTIKATNGITPAATQPFTLTVDQAPMITSADHATFTVGVPGSFDVAVTGYPSPTVNESGTLPDGVTWTAPAHTLSGTPALGTAGTYALSFRATNGVSPAATQVFTLVVPTVPPADRTAPLPGAPTLTTAVPGTGEVHLVWTAPKTAGSAAVTGYEVCDTTTAAALTRCPTATTAGTATSLTLTGLTDGTTYDFEVRAKDASGYGPFSNEKTATPGAPPPPSATRVFGQTPDATAAAELARAFPFTKGVCPASRAAVVATTTTYQDALSSQYLAQSLTTGTLLTPTKSLSPVTASALKDEGITTVYLVGGPLALTTTVAKAISNLTAYSCGGKTPTGKITVTRLYGKTQYGTAAAIAEHVGTGASLFFPGAYATTNATGGTGKYNDTKGNGSSAPTGPVPTAILANGTELQDAQAASVVSYHTRLPLLLTPATTLSPTALGAIGKLGIKQVILMGGTLAVTNTVENALAKAGVFVLRVAGKDGTDTAVQLARFEAAGSTAGLGWTPGHRVLVARGNGFTDGIAGALLDGPHNTATGAAGTVRPLLLTESPTTAGTSLTTFLKVTGHTGIEKTTAKTITSLTILGGPLAVSTAVVTQMQTALAH
jgi:putative cell wall-binding protein